MNRRESLLGAKPAGGGGDTWAGMQLLGKWIDAGSGQGMSPAKLPEGAGRYRGRFTSSSLRSASLLFFL